MTLAEIFAETQERTKVTFSNPKAAVREFIDIKPKFQYAMDHNIPILIESSDLNLTQSVVVVLDYVGERWCKGYVTYHRVDGDSQVPYTISYADVYTLNDPQSKSKNLKIIFQGDTPYHD